MTKIGRTAFSQCADCYELILGALGDAGIARALLLSGGFSAFYGAPEHVQIWGHVVSADQLAGFLLHFVILQYNARRTDPGTAWRYGSGQ